MRRILHTSILLVNIEEKSRVILPSPKPAHMDVTVQTCETSLPLHALWLALPLVNFLVQTDILTSLKLDQG